MAPALLQELLEACYLRAHPEEKTAPSTFDWSRVAPAALRELEARRKRKNPGGRARPERRAAAQARYRARQKARLGATEYLARRAEESARQRRGEAGIRYEARLAQIEHNAARKAKERSKSLGTRLALLALADLEAPTYVVAIPGKKRERERWPLRDAAAAWLAANTPRTPGQVSKIPLDTSPESA